MRIAIIADPIDNQYAGIHIYTKEMVRALIRYDKLNEYVLIRQKKKDDFQGVEQHIVPNFPKLISYPSLRLFILLPMLLRRLKVNAVLEPAHFGPFNLPKKIKRITIIHDLTPILFPHMHRFHSQFLQKIFLKGILKRADLIISNSDNTSNDIYKQYPFTKNKVRRIYPGKEDYFRVDHNAKVISKYRLDEKYFLSVGTIEPRKNLLILLEAYTSFRVEHKGFCKLMIVGGKGWKSTSFFEALEKHPYKKDIHMLGYVERNELPVLFSNALAFIYPSMYEGFGLPVLEAMACGAPCIVSNSSSLPEVGGNAAVYFSPTDQKALADRMIHLAEDVNLRKSLEEKSLVQSEKFSWKSYAGEFMKIIDKLK